MGDAGKVNPSYVACEHWFSVTDNRRGKLPGARLFLLDYYDPGLLKIMCSKVINSDA